MLLVSSFNPTVRNSGNRIIKTSNQGYQLKPNKVSFKSTKADLTNSAEKEIAEITQHFLNNYPDILGNNFKKNVLKPWEDFLKYYGVSIKHEPSRWETRTHPFAINYGSVEDGYKARLVANNGRMIHSAGSTNDGPYIIRGVTKNHSTINLINEFISGKLKMNDNPNEYYPNPLKGIIIPENLKNTAMDVDKALADFQYRWVCTPHDGDNLKVERLQRAFTNLMPED